MTARFAYERRKLERKRVIFAANLDHLDHASAVRVVDLSPTGAKLVGDDLPGRNSGVELHRNGKKMRGRIAWESNNRAGLQFEEACDVLSLLRPIASPKPLHIEPFRRTPLKPARLSWGEQLNIERCAALLGISFSQ